jgi:2'-5' RNA ligase
MVARDEVTHRLFFAFDLDEPCRRAVQRLVDELVRRIDLRGPAPGGRVKWVERENLHLTVSFLGSTPEQRLDAIRAALETPFNSQTFGLRFDRLGAFPERGAPRVIWIGDSRGTTLAEAVQRELAERLKAVDVPAETRPFRAHLTLGRFREPGGHEDAQAIREVAVEPIGPLLIDHLTLYESHLSSRGPSYDALVRVALK